MLLPEITEVIPTKANDLVISSFQQGQTLTIGTNTLANASGIALPGRDVLFEFDRSNPIDWIKVFVNVMIDVAPNALGPDGYAQIVKNILFQRNGVEAAPTGGAKRGTVTVVNARGVDLLQRRHQVANLDNSTLAALITWPAVHNLVTLCYHIDLANDQLDDPLRAYTLCPVHIDGANPTLKVSLAANNEIDVGTNVMRVQLQTVEVHVGRRDMPPERTAEIINNGGFIEMDMISNSFAMTQSTKQKVVITSPGLYESIQLTQYNTATTRGDFTDVNNRAWTVSQQGKTRREFTLYGLKVLNEDSKFQTGGTQPFTQTQLLDFVSDQCGAPDNNLNSLLNANLEAQNGQQTLLQFTGGAAAATLWWMGRRILSVLGARATQFST